MVGALPPAQTLRINLLRGIANEFAKFGDTYPLASRDKDKTALAVEALQHIAQDLEFAGIASGAGDLDVAARSASVEIRSASRAKAGEQKPEDLAAPFIAARLAASLPTSGGGDDNAAKETPSAGAPTCDAVTSYLRRSFPAEPDLEVTRVRRLAGGRSKSTSEFLIEGAGSLPGRLIMRQDMATRHNSKTVLDEVPVLRRLSIICPEVPRLLHVEHDTTDLGAPFVLMEAREGEAPGDYFHFDGPHPGVTRDVARFLGRLHGAQGLSDGIAAGFRMSSIREQLDRYWQTWCDKAVVPSPIIEWAFAKAFRLADESEAGPLVMVHGDVGPHNLLAKDDRLSAVLDWETAHLGEAAEDLGAFRGHVESQMPWEEFEELYVASGGTRADPRRIQLAMILNMLMGASLVAVAARDYSENGELDFVRGGIAIAGLRSVEVQLAAQFA
jgi:aminoglycoside phosphotransferase (APT) family kinase protein